MANRLNHFSYSMPETPNTSHGNGHFTNHTCQTASTRGHAHHPTLFRMTITVYEQEGIYHRGSPRSNGLLYSISPCENYNHGLHNSYITTNHLEAIQFGQARGTIYEGSLLLSVVIEQTIIQSLDRVNRKCSTNIWSGHNKYIIFQTDRIHYHQKNRLKAQPPNLMCTYSKGNCPCNIQIFHLTSSK